MILPRQAVSTAAAVLPFIEAKDPGNRLAVVRIPFSATFDTQGRHTHLMEKSYANHHIDASFQHPQQHYHRRPGEAAARPLSVCILFHRGACKSQRRCRQLHVLPKVVDRLRDEAAGPCCAAHTAAASRCANRKSSDDNEDPWGRRPVEIVEGEARKSLSEGLTTENFETTKGLSDLMKRFSAEGVIVVEAEKICGLNSLKRCKWGSRCINIHVCREASISSAAGRGTRGPPLSSGTGGGVRCVRDLGTTGGRDLVRGGEEGGGGGYGRDLMALGRFAASFSPCPTSVASSSSVFSSAASSSGSSSFSCSPPLSPSIPPLLEDEDPV
eukprot:TRINITY_DN37127_c0_g1_i1.p1 TRINITY_DN37127_c0_g1~~TRINITY_DN37127_c0_g1_i1.p1  ORF type:complete len:327 (+),score=57.80 TRINITY_DN37127_c0_g1_i1:63-1043(+)